MLKRTQDIVLGCLCLTVAAPVMLVVAAAILVVLGRPVLFRQIRPGLHGQPFELLKFRTMHNPTGPSGQPLRDDVRLTTFGRWLRRTSLDELPQFVNVLRGDMSIVGPRPLMMHYLEQYEPSQMRRHDVKPGLTGWAQVHGRNALSWEEKFRLDLWYVDHQSFALDVTIVVKTLAVVLRGDGISAPGHATMPEFHGRSRDK